MTKEAKRLADADIISLFQAGRFICQIVGKTDHTPAQVADILEKAGISSKRKKVYKVCRKIPVDTVRLKELYAEGHSTSAMGRFLGVSRGIIRARMIEAGLTPMNQSDAMYARAAKMTDEQKKAQTAAAHKKMRGRTVPRQELINIARGVQREAKLSKHEEHIRARLLSMGLETIPLLAEFKYNIDLGYPEGRVAIEVHNRWHTSGRKALADAKKLEHLNRNGWAVFYLDSNVIYPGALETIVNMCLFRRQFFLNLVVGPNYSIM